MTDSNTPLQDFFHQITSAVLETVNVHERALMTMCDMPERTGQGRKGLTAQLHKVQSIRHHLEITLAEFDPVKGRDPASPFTALAHVWYCGGRSAVIHFPAAAWKLAEEKAEQRGEIADQMVGREITDYLRQLLSNEDPDAKAGQA